MRILVAAGEVVGAVQRVVAPGEWRTDVALGAERSRTAPPPQACLIALGAAGALGTDLVGVDLLPDGNGGWVVLELNGAVDFTPEYGLDAADVFERVVRVLMRSARGGAEGGDVSELAGGQRRARAIAAMPCQRQRGRSMRLRSGGEMS